MLVGVRWLPREESLEPRAVAAFDAVARSLGERILRIGEERLARLRGVAGNDVLVALGNAEDLPWVDGVDYLGIDARAPGLLVPTTSRPDVPLALLERALMRRLDDPRAPIAVIPSKGRVVACFEARAISIERLRAWLEGAR